MNNKVYVLYKLTGCDYDSECPANHGCRNSWCDGKTSKEITLNEKYFIVLPNKNKVLVGCNQSKSNLLVECKKQGEQCSWAGTRTASYCCRAGLTCVKNYKYVGFCKKGIRR